MTGSKTALMQMSAVGDEERVRALLRQGVAVNDVDEDGDTALYYAASKRNQPMVALLLSHGADPNVIGTSGSVLRLAANQGWTEILDAVIDAGADVNYREAGGFTALMLASGAGRVDTIRRLHARGADLSATDNDGDSALYYAASKGKAAAVETLLSLGSSTSDRPTASGSTPLLVAAVLASPTGQLPPGTTRNDYTNIVRQLLRAGADPTLIYSQNLLLWKSVGADSMEIAPLELVSQLDFDDDWRVLYETEAGRVQRATRSREQPTANPPSSPNSDQPIAKSRVEVFGPTQTGFVNNPTIKIQWNGKPIGTVRNGERFSFDIDSDGEARFSYLFRSARVQVNADRPTVVRLAWDRAWGRLIASRNTDSAPGHT